MKKNAYVTDLTPDGYVRDVFLISSAANAETKNGKPYWRLTLQDSSGRIEAMIWPPLSTAFTDLAPGQFVHVQGTVGSFQNKIQIKVDELDVVQPDAEGLHTADFLPASQTDPHELMKQVEYLAETHLAHPPLRDFCFAVLNDIEIRQRLLGGFGAKTVHHAYVGGLLEHTLAVVRQCMAMCDIYPQLDRQILLVGALFHDLGKAWELSGGLENDYTDEGRLLGHIVLGLEKLEPFLAKADDLDPELVLHLKHLVVSHHGEHEFGSPVRPKTPEAFALHFADNMDAKLNIISGAYAEMGEGLHDWSPYQRFLERNVFRPGQTPDESTPNESEPQLEPADDEQTREKEEKEKADNQCLLPLKG